MASPYPDMKSLDGSFSSIHGPSAEPGEAPDHVCSEVPEIGEIGAELAPPSRIAAPQQQQQQQPAPAEAPEITPLGALVLAGAAALGARPPAAAAAAVEQWSSNRHAKTTPLLQRRPQATPSCRRRCRTSPRPCSTWTSCCTAASRWRAASRLRPPSRSSCREQQLLGRRPRADGDGQVGSEGRASERDGACSVWGLQGWRGCSEARHRS